MNYTIQISKMFTRVFILFLLVSMGACKENTNKNVSNSADILKPVGDFMIDKQHNPRGMVRKDCLTVRHLKEHQYYMVFYNDKKSVKYSDLVVIKDSIIYDLKETQKVSSFSPDFQKVIGRNKLYNRVK